jgi:uncharacterized DUF497 family protein
MKIEYDKNKSIINKQKHGVDFEESKIIWFGDNVILPAATKGERRYMIIGKIGVSLYSCIFTVREQNIRVISCRKSREREKKVYHEKVK